jgi:hypothetical protein
MDLPPKPIAIVAGADGALVQQLLREFAERHRQSLRVVGAVESARPAGAGSRRGGTIHNLADGRSYPLFQDLGPGSAGCALDPTSLVLASEAVRADIARGCDVVVLSKFGKAEAMEGSGLMPAFVAAIEAGVPLLTSVAPKHVDAWETFAAPFFATLPAEAGAIEQWWDSVHPGRHAAAQAPTRWYELPA